MLLLRLGNIVDMSFIKDIVESIRATLNLGFWHGVAVSVVIAFLTLFGKWLLREARTFLQRQIAFSVAGPWIGECSLPHDKGSPNLEIWLYTQKKENVNFKFFAYAPDRLTQPTKWMGGGVYRGSKLSGYYYKFEKRTPESGVIALELKGRWLKGMYAQFDPNVIKDPFYIGSDYVQCPIHLPLRSQLKMILGRPPFRSYEEVQKIYEGAKASIEVNQIEYAARNA